MNWVLVGDLIRLRYKLLWARTRSRNGRIALMVVGFLLFILIMALLGAGGIGAGLVAVRVGKAEKVAEVVLGSLFMMATMTTVVLGFGISTVFTETELRRYPLTAAERRLGQHLVGIADPFWFLVLALELGLSVGLFAMGAAGFWTGLIAVMALMASNYLLARLVALIVDRLIRRKGGSVLLMLLMFCLVYTPATVAALMPKHPALRAQVLAALRWTPPFGAAALMTAGGAAAFLGLAVVVGWIAVFAFLVAAVERRPPQRQRSVAKGPIRWGAAYERVGALFGQRYSPLVGFWVRFYVRNKRFRAMYLLTLPLAAFLVYQMSHVGRHPIGLFAAALGVFPMCGFFSTSRFAVNLFGYTEGSFRRFFLLPIDPTACLRAASYASLLLGASELVLALAVWEVVSPAPADLRMAAMLAGMGVMGLFGLNGAGLWATLYSPRRGRYHSAMGNDLSLVGNVLLIGSLMVPLIAVQIWARRGAAFVLPQDWWMAMAAAAIAVAFYFVMLRATAAQFTGRRERMMAVVEGKD